MLEYIPEGWKWVELQEVCERIKVGLATSVTKYYTEIGVPIIRNLNIKQGYFDDYSMLYLQEEFANMHPNKRVKAGDVITVHTGANIGLTCVVPKKYADAHTFTTLITTTQKHRLNPEYMTYYVNSHYGQAEIQRLVVGGGKGNLNTGDFVKYKLLLPSIREQVRIVKILSSWDTAITLTNQRLAAAQQRKKALMQQLLTGRLRFPEFEGEAWRKELFSKLLNIEIGRTPSRKNLAYWDSDKKTDNVWIAIADLDKKYIRNSKEYISNDGVRECHCKIVPADTVIMSFKLTIGRAAILTRPAFTNEAICSLIPKNENMLSTEYLYQALSVVNFEREIDQAVKGKTLNKSKLKRLKLQLPSLPEQRRIAAVLNTCDREIQLLTQKRDALQRQKKGLMQRLLTGRIRVKV